MGAEEVVAVHLAREIVEAWRRGWQPVELVRVIGRRLDAQHGRLAADAIAAQMLEYPASRVDPRWTEQVRSLDATVWWQPGQPYLPQWCQRERVSLPAAIRCVERLLAVLRLLPAIALLCPLPGAGQGTRIESPRILHKVRALLAKAESTEFAHEAEALTAKAQEIIARHSIDAAMLASATEVRAEPRGARVGIDSPYDQQKAALLNEVAAANRCRTVWSKELCFATVFGFDTDLASVELLYTSLLVQATTSMTGQGSRHTAARTRSFRQSFLAAFALRIGQRLRGAAEGVTRQAGASPLPVLVEREEQVRETMRSHFPRLVSRDLATGTDPRGWVSGTAAADRAIIGVRDQVCHPDFSMTS